MNNALVSECILSGILAGNEKLQNWAGMDWVCDRPNTEFMIVAGIGDQLHAKLPDWFVWPENSTGDDFRYVGTDYKTIKGMDCPPRNVFGGVRYDLGLLRARDSIAGIIEAKRFWETSELTKIAHALLYLGANPIRQPLPRKGVALESVFFGAFIFRSAREPGAALPLPIQFGKMQAALDEWWTGATTPSGLPLQAEFRRVYGTSLRLEFSTRAEAGGIGDHATDEAGAVCVCLSLDDTP